MTTNPRLLLAGCGKMGGALLEGWLRQGIRAENLFVVEPDRDTAQALATDHGVAVRSHADDLPSALAPDVVIMAVKPQTMDEVVPSYTRFRAPGTVFLSIAAGKTIAYFATRLGSNAAIVRAMPNTPAAVGRGMTVCCGNEHVGKAQKALCDRLLRAVGRVEWVRDEGMMDAVTAVSGGGPAYVFLLAESLAMAGIAAGLPQDLSRRLARETVAGSGELLFQSAEDTATLRKNVTSPGGTTAEALRVLMGDDGREGWQPLIDAAVRAAARRSRELAN